MDRISKYFLVLLQNFLPFFVYFYGRYSRLHLSTETQNSELRTLKRLGGTHAAPRRLNQAGRHVYEPFRDTSFLRKKKKKLNRSLIKPFAPRVGLGWTGRLTLCAPQNTQIECCVANSWLFSRISFRSVHNRELKAVSTVGD